MSILVHFNDQSKTIRLCTVFNDYCCTYEEACEVIQRQFDFKNSLSDYNMRYYDPSYSTWVNFNIHVSNRITELLRYSSSNTLEIRLDHKPTSSLPSFIKKEISEKSNKIKYANMILWLDEYVGNSFDHKQFKKMCQNMINTHENFLEYNDINTIIQYNDNIETTETILQPTVKNILQDYREYSCQYQCILFACDNTDEFLSILHLSLDVTNTLSVVMSGTFAKEVLPIIISYKKKQLLPEQSLLYVLCANIQYYYDWALGYIENETLDIDTNLELFDDDRAMVVRVINDIRRYLIFQADQCRTVEKDSCRALQYYKTARQLFLNTLPWKDCPTLDDLNHLNQLIEQMQIEVIQASFCISNNLDEIEENIRQQCM